MTNIIYTGPFGKHIINHVKLKQSLGFKYIAEARHLKRFDTFTREKYSFITPSQQAATKQHARIE